MGRIAGIGGANIDVHGQTTAPIIMRDSNLGHLHISPGGVLRNILDNAARLGLDTAIATVVGADTYGEILRSGCTGLGMDTSLMKTIPGEGSSSYISIMDNEGDMLVAINDMGILKHIDAAFVEDCLPTFNQCDLVVCDCNICANPTAIPTLVEGCKVPLYVDPTSSIKAPALLPYLGSFHTIKPNRMEMEILADMSIRTVADLEQACAKVLATGVQRIFVSLGRDGIFYCDGEGILRGQSHDFDLLTNATGAGDATMAGILYATQMGFDREKTLLYALAAGLAAISSRDTINAEMNVKLLEKMIKEYLI